MMNYQSFINSAQLISDVESTATTGDVEYPGTALEITDGQGKDLVHFVIDDKGEVHALFFARRENYRIPLDLLEKAIARARDVVKKAP